MPLKDHRVSQYLGVGLDKHFYDEKVQQQLTFIMLHPVENNKPAIQGAPNPGVTNYMGSLLHIHFIS